MTPMRVGFVALTMLVGACGGGDLVGESGVQTTTTQLVTTAPAGPTAHLPSGSLPEGSSALDNMPDPTFPEPLVAPSDIIHGGPPPDGIPPIDEPSFVSVKEANQWLVDEEPVVAVEIEGDAAAYPIQILIWHEIVNDEVGGTPITVTYCPLCNSAVTYRRVINEVETTFGTSGRLYASALVMYDRATESLWTHFDGRAVVGLLTGEELTPIASPLLAWKDFEVRYPEGKVLSRETGHRRPYGTNPYEGYDDPDTSPFLFRGALDDRARAKQRVVGVALGGEAKAWTLEAISGGEARVTHDEVGGELVVILWKPGQASALEDEQVSKGRDVGSVAVFRPQADGRSLTFELRGEAFFDRETGSEWDITGRAIEGRLADSDLEQIHHLDTFWFAWSTYQPGTELVEE